jgi:hypothetical protein
MKARLRAIGLLLAGLTCLLGSCGDDYESGERLRVSARDDTWLEIETHWTGAFAGSAHNEYTLYYVRRGGWWQEDERRSIRYWPSVPSRSGPGPVLRRIDAHTIAVETPEENGRVSTTTYSFTGPWPN